MIGRRGMLASMVYGAGGLGQPRRDQEWRRGPDRQIAPGGAAGTFRGRLVVIFGTGANLGIFVYSGTPALGNLVASIAAAAGTDPYGNAYLAGNTSYNPSVSPLVAVNTSLAQLAYFTAPGPGGPWMTAASVSLNTITGALNFTVFSGNPIDLNSPSIAVAGVWADAGVPSGSPPAGAETWHDLGSTGLVGDAGTASYRFTAEGELQLSIHKSFTALGAITSATFGTVLPAAYIPPASRLTGGEPIAINGGAPGNSTRLTITGATGAVNLVNLPAGATAVGCDVRIPLI